MKDAADMVVANFTVHMPGEVENILSMESFDDMLTSIECNDQGLHLTFEDDATFAYAKKVWDWVNGADNHNFILVAGAGDCKWNDARQPFDVSRLSYDEGRNVAHLTAKAVQWADLAHTYDLQVGHVAAPDAALQRRIDLTPDISGGVSVPFFASFPFGFKVNHEGLTGGIECSNCFTRGRLDFEFVISTVLGVPTGAKLKAAPRGVRAEAQVKVFGGGEVDTPLQEKWDIADVPIAGVSIKDILKLGPNFGVGFGLEVGPASGEFALNARTSLRVPDSAYTEIDLIHPERSRKSSWAPVIERQLTFDAKIAIESMFFFNPAVRISATALSTSKSSPSEISRLTLPEFGYEIGLEGKMPYVKAKLEGGSCE